MASLVVVAILTKETRAKSAGEVFTLVKFLWTIHDVLRKTILE